MFKKRDDAVFKRQTLEKPIININDSLKRKLAREGYGKKITNDVVEVAMKGRFDGVDRKILEKHWDAWKRIGKYQRETGTGVALVLKDNEGLGHAGLPLRGKLDPMKSKILPLDPLSLHPDSYNYPIFSPEDISEYWTYYNGIKIHVSRLCFFQPNFREDDWTGIGTVEANYQALLILDKLQEGAIDRTSVWAYNEMVVKANSTSLTRSAGITNLTDRLDKNFTVIDSKDSILTLEDRAGLGKEIEDLALDALSAGTGIPRMVLTGNQLGAVTGSEVDLTQWGEVLVTFQGQMTNFLTSLFSKFWGMDLGDVDWNVNFYTSREKQLTIERMELENEKLRTLPSPEPKEEGEMMLDE